MVLSSMLGSRDLEDISDAKESFLSIPIGDDLEYCEVFKHTVHHVLLWKMFEFENKVDHVFTHRGPVEFVNKPSTFKSGIFGLNFFHHLFTEAANFRGTLNSHIFGALIS